VLYTLFLLLLLDDGGGHHWLLVRFFIVTELLICNHKVTEKHHKGVLSQINMGDNSYYAKI
jgi:hypothetical protein